MAKRGPLSYDSPYYHSVDIACKVAFQETRNMVKDGRDILTYYRLLSNRLRRIVRGHEKMEKLISAMKK